MKAKTKTNIQLFGAFSLFLYLGLALVGWWLVAGFLPLHSPADDARTISSFYQNDPLMIRLGMILVMMGTGFYIPATATIAQQISRIEGGVGVLTLCQVMAGLGLVFLTFFPALWWVAASFRPERAADLIQLMNDFAWLQFVGGLWPFIPVYLTIAIASLSDDSDQPAIPRWCGFFNLWTFVLVLPTQLIFFFKTGPFAWNGIIGIWLPVTVFSAWFFVMYFVLRKAILRQAEEVS